MPRTKAWEEKENKERKKESKIIICVF